MSPRWCFGRLTFPERDEPVAVEIVGGDGCHGRQARSRRHVRFVRDLQRPGAGGGNRTKYECRRHHRGETRSAHRLLVGSREIGEGIGRCLGRVDRDVLQAETGVLLMVVGHETKGRQRGAEHGARARMSMTSSVTARPPKVLCVPDVAPPVSLPRYAAPPVCERSTVYSLG